MWAYDKADSEIENIIYSYLHKIKKSTLWIIRVNYSSGINLNKPMKAMDVQHRTEIIT